MYEELINLKDEIKTENLNSFFIDSVIGMYANKGLN